MSFKCSWLQLLFSMCYDQDTSTCSCKSGQALSPADWRTSPGSWSSLSHTRSRWAGPWWPARYGQFHHWKCLQARLCIGYGPTEGSRHLLTRVTGLTLTSAFLSFRAFPHLRMKGTPSHLSLLIRRTAAAKVGQVEPSGTVLSSRYPNLASGSSLSGSPSYWPRTQEDMARAGMAFSTFTFSSLQRKYLIWLILHFQCNWRGRIVYLLLLAESKVAPRWSKLVSVTKQALNGNMHCMGSGKY